MLIGVPDEITSVADYYANQDNWPPEIEQISRVMLTKLTTPFDDKQNVYSDTFSNLLAPKYRNHYDERYYVFTPDKARQGSRYFYTYMDDQGYPLYDWEFLYDLAVANGYESHINQEFTQAYYHNTDNILEYLVNLLTNPRGEDFITYKTDAEGNPVYKTDADGDIIYETNANGESVPVRVIESFESITPLPTKMTSIRATTTIPLLSFLQPSSTMRNPLFSLLPTSWIALVVTWCPTSTNGRMLRIPTAMV